MAAFWDPYGHTERIPVVVVNLDQGYLKDGEIVNHGKDVTSKLKHNDDLGWNFDNDLKSAEEGLTGDKYFAMIIIPKSFSSDLEGIQDGELNKPVLKFIPNEKKNYIASLINKKAATALQTSVGDNISSAFTNEVFLKLYEVKDGIITAAEATGMMEDGVRKLKDKMPVLDNGLDKLHEGTELFEEKMGTAYDGTNTLKDAASTLRDKMPDLVDGVEELNSGTELFDEKIKTAYDGTATLKDVAGTLKDKMPDLNDGVEKLNEGSKLFQDKLQTAYDGTNALKDAVSGLKDKMPELNDGVNDLYDASGKMTDAVGQLSDKLPDLVEGIDKLSDGVSKLGEGLKGASGKSGKLAEGTKQFSDVVSDTEEKMVGLLYIETENLKATLTKMKRIAPMLKIPPQQIDVVITDLNELEKCVNQIHNVNFEFEPNNPEKNDIEKQKFKAAYEIQQITKSYEEHLERITMGTKIISQKLGEYLKDNLDKDPNNVNVFFIKMGIDNLNTILSGKIDKFNLFKELNKVEQAKIGAQVLSVSNEMLHAGLEQGAVPGIEKIDSGMNTLSSKMPELISAVDTMHQWMGYLQEGVGVLKGKVPDLDEGFGQLDDGASKLSAGMLKLKEASVKMTEGTEELSSKVPDLDEGISMLYDGSAKLNDGMLKINSASAKLKEGVNELNAKVPDLDEGVSLLYDGTSKLNDGVLKLKGASSTLEEGTGMISDKMPELKDGVNTLYDATGALHDRLNEGADKLGDKLVMSSNDMASYMNEPVKMEKEEVFEVPNYGTGFTPYFISLGLWVGALMMFFIIPDKTNVESSPVEAAFGKYITYIAIGTIQAIILSIVVMKLGLTPSNVKVYMLFNIFLSYVCITIIQCLIYLFDDAGRLMGTILLLLQLTSCGGTFSVELLPKFFRNISPYMPFTYSVSAIREIISGIDKNVLYKDIKMLLIFQVIFLMMLFLGVYFKEKIKNKFSEVQSDTEAVKEGI